MKKKRSFWDRLMTAVKAQDEEAIKAELESKDADESEEETKDSDEPEKKEETAKAKDEAGDIKERLARIEAVLAKLVPAEEREHGQAFDEDEEEEMSETSDEILEAETAEKNGEAVGRVLSGDSLKQIVARAEILSPGIAIPTGDAIKSKDAAPKLMRKALENAYETESGKACVDTFLMSRELSALTGDALMGVFNGAAELMRIKNNDAGGRHGISTKDFGKAVTPADMNARNRAFWANR